MNDSLCLHSAEFDRLRSQWPSPKSHNHLILRLAYKIGILPSDELFKRSSTVICKVVSILFDPEQDSVNESIY